MQSIRHGLRVLQRSDVSQLDWHLGQILCHFPKSVTSSTEKPTPRAVFIDFSNTVQTTYDRYTCGVDDYGFCFEKLCFSNLPGLDVRWIVDYWQRDDMKREGWDCRTIGMIRKGVNYVYKPKDPYGFVYEMKDKPNA